MVMSVSLLVWLQRGRFLCVIFLCLKKGGNQKGFKNNKYGLN